MCLSILPFSVFTFIIFDMVTNATNSHTTLSTPWYTKEWRENFGMGLKIANSCNVVLNMVFD